MFIDRTSSYRLALNRNANSTIAIFQIQIQ